MLGIAIIILRETFEAALLIGIIAAATRTIPRRSRWIIGGIGAGLAGALAVAMMTGEIAGLFDGMGQEIFNAAVLGLAVALLGGHNIWMSAHGRELAASAQGVGRNVNEGRQELSAILIVIALAVLREGSESVLFTYGVMSSGEVSTQAAVAGALLGLLGGAALGTLLYAGMLRIPMKLLFSATNLLILLLAAGMAARMAQFLIQANLLPPLSSPVWDSSSMLPMNSPVGIFMHALVGYDAAPDGMQVVFYVVTILAIMSGMWWVRQTSRVAVQ